MSESESMPVGETTSESLPEFEFLPVAELMPTAPGRAEPAVTSSALATDASSDHPPEPTVSFSPAPAAQVDSSPAIDPVVEFNESNSAAVAQDRSTVPPTASLAPATDAQPAASTEPEVEPFSSLSPWLAEAFRQHGFDSLTPIQKAISEPGLSERDLRVASATGSGKTVAVAMALAAQVEAAVTDRKNGGSNSGPGVLVIAPTRELAQQLQGELYWIYESLRPGVTLVRGGGEYRRELRSLRQGPEIVVGTPGRLVDHLQRGTLDLSAIRAVVLDEADQLLDLGFKEALDTLLVACPEQRRTLLVSATFNGAVKKLADAHQTNPAWVRGTPINEQHADIRHVVHVVQAGSHLPALINILLLCGKERCLVFVERRAQAAEIAGELAHRGFNAGPLSGDMAQTERNRTLGAFRDNRLTILVATDVAARGIDVQGIRTVVHAHSPHDSDSLVHRSGRTGRAGQQGTSIQLCLPKAQHHVRRLLKNARITAEWLPAPSAADVHRVENERLFDELSSAQPGNGHHDSLAQRLLEEVDPALLVASLVAKIRELRGCEAEEVRSVTPASADDSRDRNGRRDSRPRNHGDFVSFDLSYGKRHGATPQRVLAMVCRRGNVKKRDIGKIFVGTSSSEVSVSKAVATAFLSAMSVPDDRDRHVQIRPGGGSGPSRGPRQRRDSGRQDGPHQRPGGNPSGSRPGGKRPRSS